MAALLIVVAYLAGSIPTGVLLTRLRGIDPRRAGSGNIGATNVARTAGLGLGLATLVGDLAKGAVPVAVASRSGLGDPVLAGTAIAAVVGHLAPITLGFRGGKGVATALGTLLILAPGAAGTAVLTFAATLWLTRFVSVASLAAAFVAPIVMAVQGAPEWRIGAMATMAALIALRHLGNVRRLIDGTEPSVRLPGRQAVPKD